MTAIRGRTLLVVVSLATLAIAHPSLVCAQRGGGGRGGGGRGAGAGEGAYQYPLTRMQLLEADFNLKKDQKKTVKTILDEAHKSAAPIRDALTRTRDALAGAVEANKAPGDIDAAVQGYAEQVAAMTALEMNAFGRVLQALDEDQRTNQAGVRSAFFLMHGMFLDDKRWDDVPDSRSY
jgi:Heavy-metal resistance